MYSRYLNYIKHLFLSSFLLGLNIISTAQPEDIYEMDLESAMQLKTQRAGILGLPHLRNKGEILLKYEFNRMNMENIYVGSKLVSTTSLLGTRGGAYSLVPDKIESFTHSFSGLYGFSDKLAINFAGRYLINDMRGLLDLKNTRDISFRLGSEGLTDFELSAFYTVFNRDQHSFLINTGIMFPTGSIEKTWSAFVSDSVGRFATYPCPFPMQLGSGTVDPKISLTYLNSTQSLSIGIDIGAIPRLYDNVQNYRKGNEYWIKAGVAYNIDDLITISSRIDYNKWDNNTGVIPGLNPKAMYVADPTKRGGQRLDGSLGLSMEVPKGKLKGNRITVDFKTPLLQNLNGPQLNEASRVIITWSQVFGVNRLF